MIALFRVLLSGALALWVLAAVAQPIKMVPGSVNIFRDTRGANDVGQTAGERMQFGADIVGGSSGASVRAFHLASGASSSLQLCGPLAISANFCAGATSYSAARIDTPWLLQFSRGAEALSVFAPSLLGSEQPVPFPGSVTLSGGGVTPRISWQVPGSFAPDSFRVVIYDKSVIRENGLADVLHSVSIDPGASFYDIPSTLSGGAVLAMGGNYTVNLQLVQTRGHVPLSNNAQILHRSSSFFAFTPLASGSPLDVALPTVANGVYNFNVGQVGPSSITFIDPLVAVGYDYAVGVGDPNFASVLLPDVGDGQYTLSFDQGGALQTVALGAGTQYFFGGGGVAQFQVAGIEPEAGLDPGNVTAFVTGLTFASVGSFTGTMAPITAMVPVPEPQAWALWALGLLALWGRGDYWSRRIW